MRRHWLMLPAVLVALGPRAALPYQSGTHERLGTLAAEDSVLTKTLLLSELGLQPLDDNLEKFPNSKNEGHSKLKLIEDGTKFEDGTWDSSSGFVLRYRNHFYDPVHDQGLSPGILDPGALAVCALKGCEKSPDWALEDSKEFDDQPFSYRDARAAMLLALTSEHKADRDVEWGKTFESLGHVIHHLQDMAQPQHVRNDSHALGSFYENYTDGKLNSDAFIMAYPSVTFPTPAQFWQTDEHCEAPDVCWGSGIAEFTNFNFVSAGSNFLGSIDVDANGVPLTGPLTHLGPNDYYPRPDPGPSAAGIKGAVEATSWSDAEVQYPFPIEPNVLQGKVYFIVTPVYDGYTGETGSARVSTYSIYDDELQHFNINYDECQATELGFDCPTQATLTLNRYNADSLHTFLLPRARAYSAGLIDYFFRGRLGFRNDPDTPGSFLIENKSVETMRGTFRLYADDFDGIRKPVKNLSWTSQQITIAGGGAADVPFVPQLDLPPNTDSYTLVFQGRLGEETNAVAAKYTVADPVGFANPAGRLVYGLGGWQFAKNTSLQYGTTNWYGTAGTVSWQGPLGRSNTVISALRLSQLSDVIYRGGKSLPFPAPGRVIGAALRDLPDGTYLIVIVPITTVTNGVEYAIGDQAYRTKLQDENESFGPSWEAGPSVAYQNLPRPQNVSFYVTQSPGHYYFNASGSEAQSMRQYQRITFSWEGGFSAVLNPIWPACQSAYDVTHRVNAVGADYRGDELLLATIEWDNRCGGISYGQIHYGDDLGQQLIVKNAQGGVVFQMPMPNTFDAFFGSSSAPRYHRNLAYFDLRTPSPTVVFYDDQTTSGTRLLVPGWVVNGVLDGTIGPARPLGVDPGPSVATNAAGDVILDWPYYDTSRLYPFGDPQEITGTAGPVGTL